MAGRRGPLMWLSGGLMWTDSGTASVDDCCRSKDSWEFRFSRHGRIFL